MNSVFNFSHHGIREVRPGLRSAAVPSHMPANLAAEIAEMNGLDALVVTDESGQAKGVFFPDYLREHLPVNPRVVHLILPERLPDMITSIDFHLPDFHSEDVNIQPDLRVCPVGPHVSASNPCRTHHVPTEPY